MKLKLKSNGRVSSASSSELVEKDMLLGVLLRLS